MGRRRGVRAPKKSPRLRARALTITSILLFCLPGHGGSGTTEFVSVKSLSCSQGSRRGFVIFVREVGCVELFFCTARERIAISR